MCVFSACVCPYRTDAVGGGLRTPGTWACPGVQPASLRTAASQTCTAAEFPA